MMDSQDKRVELNLECSQEQKDYVMFLSKSKGLNVSELLLSPYVIKRKSYAGPIWDKIRSFDSLESQWEFLGVDLKTSAYRPDFKHTEETLAMMKEMEVDPVTLKYHPTHVPNAETIKTLMEEDLPESYDNVEDLFKALEADD